MAVEDLLSVAWQADRDGLGPLREAMLTLAIGASEPGDAWAERCRARLLADRPSHFLGSGPTLAATLADPRVAAALGKLRGQYPPGRVSWLRFRAEVEAGPFTGAVAPLESILTALIGAPAEADVRRDPPEPARGPRSVSRALVAAGSHVASAWTPALEGATGEFNAPEPPSIEPEPEPEDDPAFAGFYMAVLLAIALLMATVERDRDDGRRAA